MPREVFDTIVIGVGGMGSAAVYELARRKRRVLGLEQFTIPHELGSSAGSTRIFRFAYFEDPRYVPLMRRSFARWQALQRDFGEEFLTVTGGLDIGLPASRVVTGAKAACRQHGLAHDVLDARAAAARFPAWQLPPGFEAVFQPEAGFLRADRAILAHATLARRLGAETHEGEAVRAWRASTDRVEVQTDSATYEAGTLVIAAGAWTGKLAPRLARSAVPERQVVGWFETANPDFTVGRFPVFIFQEPSGRMYYGFPDHGQGLKVGKFRHRYEVTDPDQVARGIAPEDEQELRALAPFLAGGIGATAAFKTCMFVMSPDEHFILDVLPDHRNVVLAAGFSGHGFKFCSGIGEILADLAMSGDTAHDIELFKLRRPALNAAI
jgi:sarcosine oxidase